MTRSLLEIAWIAAAFSIAKVVRLRRWSLIILNFGNSQIGDLHRIRRQKKNATLRRDRHLERLPIRH